MNEWSDREKAFENKFAHDEELKFKAIARRNKLLGLWAAELLGRNGDAAAAYASEVVAADLEEPGDDDVFRKVRSDLTIAGLGLTDEEIRAQMLVLLGKAVDEVAKA